MKKNNIFKIFLCLCYSIQLFSYQFVQRKEHQNLKVSVIIPCAGQHFYCLKSLFKLLQNQTCIPDEVVVSLSSTEHLNSEEIEQLKNEIFPFKTKILCFQGKQSAGKNRNIACSHAEGDILIAQDADDIPHPQRIEIIKYVFENYATEHLLHSYFVGEKPFSPYDVSDIKIYQYPTYNAIDFSNEFHDRIHNGNIAISKKLSRLVKWEDALPEDHDVQFNRNVYRMTRNTHAILCDLIMYRPQLSSFKPSNIPWE